MGFAIAMNVGVICSRARWSRAETYTFIVLASNCPLPGVFFFFKALFKCQVIFSAFLKYWQEVCLLL